jgi:peroxiredoxin
LIVPLSRNQHEREVKSANSTSEFQPLCALDLSCHTCDLKRVDHLPEFQDEKSLAGDQPLALQTGELVPSFAGKTIDDNPVRVDYSGQGPKKLYFYFTPPCRFCAKQFAYWRDILAHVDANQFEVIGLVKETEDVAKLKTYLREMGCSSDSPASLKVVLVSDDVLERYKLSPTPATVIVSNRGIVEKDWIGLWDEANISAASSAIGVAISSP